MRLIFFSLLLIILGGIFLFSPNKVYATVYQDVVFSELMWTGSYASSADEWIELKNTTNKNINLAGWQITYIKSDAETLMLEISTGIIPANGYFLISNNSKNHLFTNGESILDIDPDYVNSSVTLSNTNLGLKVYNGKWDNGGLLIDLVGNGDAPFTGDNDLKKSMERKFPLDLGDLSNSWQNAVISENLDSNTQAVANPHNSGRPIINNAIINNPKIYLSAGGEENLFFSVEVTDPDGLSDIKEATIDLTNLGLPEKVLLYDDSTHSDKVAGDGIYSLNYLFKLLNPNIQVGEFDLNIAITDQKDLLSSGILTISIYQLSNNIIINEISPNPQNGSNDEFIELFNRGNEIINLSGWQLDDIANGGSYPYLIDQKLMINPNSYLVFDRLTTKIALHNDNDKVRLINPQGIESAVVHYGATIKGQSYNFSQSGWYWANQPSLKSANTALINNNTNIQNQVTVKFNNSLMLSNNISNDQVVATTPVSKQIDKLNIPSNAILNQLGFDNQVINNQNRQKYWIKVTEYVILFTIAFCIILIVLTVKKPAKL